jgi:uncharacterized protein (TIGR02757 family)
LTAASTEKLGRRRPYAELKRELDTFLATFDKAAHVAEDPVEYARRYRQRPDDAEVVGLLCASLAFGRVESIRQKIERALSVLGPQPAEAIRDLGRAGLREKLAGFRHRWTSGEDLADLLAGAEELRRREGSLGGAFERRFRETGDFRESLGGFAQALRQAARPEAKGTFAHLIPDVFAGSACKRLALYARWMIREDDGVDLGLWDVPARALVIPVDTHIARIAHYIGLTERQDTSWRTAEEITQSLRRLDPEDPVKYDFALCHLGVSGACPRKRHPVKCEGCPIRAVCRL